HPSAFLRFARLAVDSSPKVLRRVHKPLERCIHSRCDLVQPQSDRPGAVLAQTAGYANQHVCMNVTNLLPTTGPAIMRDLHGRVIHDWMMQTDALTKVHIFAAKGEGLVPGAKAMENVTADQQGGAHQCPDG